MSITDSSENTYNEFFEKEVGNMIMKNISRNTLNNYEEIFVVKDISKLITDTMDFIIKYGESNTQRSE